MPNFSAHGITEISFAPLGSVTFAFVFCKFKVYDSPEACTSNLMPSIFGVVISLVGSASEPYNDSFIALVTEFVLSNDAIHEISPPKCLLFTYFPFSATDSSVSHVKNMPVDSL